MDNEEQVTATFQLTIADHRVKMSVDVPTGPARPRVLLPLMQEVTNLVVSIAEKGEVAAGRSISCAAGCGQCCRQLVPIAATEAYEIAALVDALPEPRRSDVRRRFTEAVQQLTDAGMVDDLRNTDRVTGERVIPFGLRYFHLGIACPFLENESCSIHPDRPLACREYLVTSEPRFCAEPETEQVVGVPIITKVSRVMRRLDRETRADARSYVPLIMALDWAASHVDEATPHPGPDVLRRFVGHLTGQQMADPTDGAPT